MTVNKRIQRIVGSTTLAINAKAKELKAQGHDVVNFAGGEPDFDTPGFIKKAAVDAIEQGFTKYTPSTGIPALKEAISEKLRKDNHLVYSSGQIVVSCGAKHSLFNLIQVLVEEGDEVLIPAPYWVSYPEMVKIAGATPKFIPTDERTQFKITPELLSQAHTHRTKLLILNSPSNPTGMLYSREELRDVAEICVEKNIFVISDEIYEKLIYDNGNYVSFASLGDDVYRLTATVNGVSKAFAMTGWRIGYLAASEEIASAVKKYQDHSTSNPNSVAQKAAIAALRDAEQSIPAMRDEFKARRDLIATCLDNIPKISYIRPQGAFYVFCNISQLGMDSTTLAKKILEEVKVATIPGFGFGADAYIRMSFATSRERIEEGTKRIAQWIRNLKPARI